MLCQSPAPMRYKRDILTLLFFFCSGSLCAQSVSSRWEMSLGAGASLYQGDLAPNQFGSFKTPGTTVQFFIGYIVSSAFVLRGGVALAHFQASDAMYGKTEDFRQRNYSFRSALTELTAQLHWNILGNSLAEQPLGFSPYLFAGVGQSSIISQTKNRQLNPVYLSNNSWVSSGWSIDSAKAHPGNITALSFGAGMRYGLSKRFALFAEVNQRLTNNDYLDGYSLAAHPHQNDQYTSLTFGLVYRFGYKFRFDCPVLK